MPLVQGQLPELMPITSLAGLIEAFSGGALCCFSIRIAALEQTPTGLIDDQIFEIRVVA